MTSPDTLIGPFPEESRFAEPLESVWSTKPCGVEESAHVFSYTTPTGRYCELWWMGADIGKPLYAYLVDEDGQPHPLPQLTIPSVASPSPFQGLEQAQTIFIAAAKQFYGEREAE